MSVQPLKCGALGIHNTPKSLPAQAQSREGVRKQNPEPPKKDPSRTLQLPGLATSGRPVAQRILAVGVGSQWGSREEPPTILHPLKPPDKRALEPKWQ